MKDHVSTLEQGQKLKELGWNKPTKFYWIKVRGQIALAWKLAMTFCCVMPNGDSRMWDISACSEIYPALLSDEALAELPEKIHPSRDVHFLDIDKEKEVWTVMYGSYHADRNKSLPIAATDMLIWALQNNYVTVEK